MLPFSADDEDKAEAIREAHHVLKTLPDDVTDCQIEQTISKVREPLCDDIRRDRRIEELIAYGRAQATLVLARLFRQEAIDREDFLGSHLRRELQELVSQALEEELDGSESWPEVDELVESIIADELELEQEPEEG